MDCLKTLGFDERTIPLLLDGHGVGRLVSESYLVI